MLQNLHKNITWKITKIFKNFLDETQYGLRKGQSRTNSAFTLKVFVEKRSE